MASESDSLYRRYQEELPADRDKAWKLLQTYSHIPADEIEPHLRAVRDKAWAIFPYHCIGAWRFLDLYVTDLPQYPRVVERLRTGDRLLDAGCCFGYVLRQLAADGAPADHLAGADLHQAFIDLGYELFRDRATFAAQFVAGDMLQGVDLAADNAGAGAGAGDPALAAALDGRFDIVHAASFFHLFNWVDQVRLGVRVVRFFRPPPASADPDRARLLFGRQVGTPTPTPEDAAERADPAQGRFHHSPATLQQLWDEIGQRTGTRWRVEANLVHGGWRPDVGSAEEGSGGGAKKERFVIQFAIYKVD
ncbi:hypothetical protein SPI_07123 [Niveomyces insectorum RCEF 264]|uniref:Methyltransferase domain-containing protein n=1 Tax=Niveomyces insectorum RCEF 264 TaxID=1081102 RepID=A0A167QAT1_9HYPO|nr:hypothetical protein SPI_07123 [Niveomyces insectorum RCEF 264]